MEKELKFEIHLSVKNVWQFSMYHANGGLQGIFNLIFTVAPLFLLATRWGVLTASYRLLLVGCAMIFTVLQPLLLLNKARKQSKTAVIRIPMFLTFHESGLLVEQSDQKAEFTWDQMARISRKPTMFILYMDRVHAYLLPKEAMGDKEEAFCEMARRYVPKERLKGI